MSGTIRALERYDPDRWTDEFAFLNQPGQADIQSDLFYNYRTNVEAYPQWQAWMREQQPRLLVIWGKYDLSFELSKPGSLLAGRAERSSSRARRRSFRIGPRLCRFFTLRIPTIRSSSSLLRSRPLRPGTGPASLTLYVG